MSLPYENSSSGKNAINEMQKILRSFGATSFGVMEDFENGVVIVQFCYQSRQIQVKASFKGYAAAWLKEHPYSSRSRGYESDHKAKALKIGEIAVYSILRDWIKGQVTAMSVGMLTFEGAFLGQILLPNGQTVLEKITEQKLLQIGN